MVPPLATHIGAATAKVVRDWRSIFGWETFLRWDVLAAIVLGVFLATGFAMLGVDWFPHNLLISQVGFSVAVLLTVIKTIGQWQALIRNGKLSDTRDGFEPRIHAQCTPTRKSMSSIVPSHRRGRL